MKSSRLILGIAIAIGLVSLGLPAAAPGVHSKLQVVHPHFEYSGLQDLGTSSDGAAIWFESRQDLLPEDTDGLSDIYRRSPGGPPVLVSGGSSSNGDWSPDLKAVAADGSRVIFETRGNMSPADSDAFPAVDVYESSGAAPTLVSTGPLGGSGSVEATFSGASADGTRIFFMSWEHLVAGDEDTCFAAQPEERPCFDLYERSAGTTKLLTPGTDEHDASFLGASMDGTHVFFETQDALVAADTDGTVSDLYERVGTNTALVSTSGLSPNQPFTPTFSDVSDDGTRVFFSTQEQLTVDDTDGGFDIFERAGGQTTKVTTGSLDSNTGAHAKFFGITPDGAHVFFDTPEQLEPADDDVQKGDLYRRSAGQTTLISTGPLPVTAPSDFLSSSLDGQRVVFMSVGKFTADDTDTRLDIYERFAGATIKLSHGNLNTNANHAFFILANA